MGLRPQNKYTAVIDPRYTRAERNVIAFAIIEFIQKRTAKGQGIGGKAFRNSAGQTKYTDSYTETREYKIAGKSQGRINLELSGDMLDSIEVLDINIAGRVVIGYNNDDENDKSVFMREKGYDFLGLSNQELNNVLAQVGSPSQQDDRTTIAPGLVQSLVRSILGG